MARLCLHDAPFGACDYCESERELGLEPMLGESAAGKDPSGDFGRAPAIRWARKGEGRGGGEAIHDWRKASVPKREKTLLGEVIAYKGAAFAGAVCVSLGNVDYKCACQSCACAAPLDSFGRKPLDACIAAACECCVFAAPSMRELWESAEAAQ